MRAPRGRKKQNQTHTHMKKLSLIAVIALGALFAFSPIMRAAEAQQGQRQRGARPDRLAQMKEQLKLTDTQVEKLKPVMEKLTAKMKEMRDGNLSQEDRRAKMKTLMEENQAEIKKILTSEQWEKWQELRKQRGQRGQRRGQQQ